MQAESGWLSRIGSRLADASERWFPDAFVFALACIVIVFMAGVATGIAPVKLATEFGNGFWSLVNFTMQMALIIVGGFVVASSPPVARLTNRLASIPQTPRGAIAFVAAFATLSSLLSWGLSLIFTGLLVRAILRRLGGVDYRAIGAAAYMGLGSVWALGLSSSSALMQATRSAIPPSLLPITGVIPLSQTIFLWQSIVMAAVLIVLTISIAWYSAPPAHRAKTGPPVPPLEEETFVPNTPAERAENSPILTLLVAALMVWFLAIQFREKGGVAALDLNNFNFAFLTLGLLLHWRPRSFLRSVAGAVPATAGVLIQFPFYGGIFGMISRTDLNETLASLFVNITTKETFPVIVAIYSAALDLFVPSGGGKWVIEAPYVMAAANQWQVHLGWTVQVYNAAEALSNLLNPFWMLPLMGILGVRARDLAGYAVLQFLFQMPVVLLLAWLFAKTLRYVPPVM